MRYYIEDNGIGIHRMNDAVCQTYDFAQGRWVHSTEIMDVFIGEPWVDEVSEARQIASPRVSQQNPLPAIMVPIRPDKNRCRRLKASVKARMGACSEMQTDPTCLALLS